jgi:release factor glutamine methyltransferase
VTVSEALAAAGIDPREARLLLAEASGFSEASVLAHPERALPPEVEGRYREFSARRARGEPIAYIVGRREFFGLWLAVNPAVLIPRPETELLVELARARNPARALDLGTGCGAIALALKRQLPRAEVVAVEASAAALAVARKNAASLNLEIDLRHGRGFAPVAGERFDVVVSNPPYVAEGDPHLAQLAFEPAEALIGGPDGLGVIREIVRAAPAHLVPGGWLLLEHGIGQERAVRELFESGGGFGEIQSWRDLAGIVRAAGGRVES